MRSLDRGNAVPELVAICLGQTEQKPPASILIVRAWTKDLEDVRVTIASTTFVSRGPNSVSTRKYTFKWFGLVSLVAKCATHWLVAAASTMIILDSEDASGISASHTYIKMDFAVLREPRKLHRP